MKLPARTDSSAVPCQSREPQTSALTRVPVFCPDSAHAALLRAALDPPFEAHFVGSWEGFSRSGIVSNAVVFVAEWIDLEAQRRLAELRALSLALSVVVVTRRDADNARAVASVGAADIVWFGDVHGALTAALFEAERRQPLAQLLSAVEANGTLTATLRRALLAAVTAEVPFRTVEELSRAVARSRTTMWRQWRKQLERSGLRLEDFCDWVLLLRAVASKRAGVGWPQVASRLGVSDQTLHRIARRLGACTLAELGRAGPALLQVRFRTAVLGALQFRPQLVPEKNGQAHRS